MPPRGLPAVGEFGFRERRVGGAAPGEGLGLVVLLLVLVCGEGMLS